VCVNLNTNGSLSATVDGIDIASGTSVQQGKSVVFNAFPNSRFRVSEWRINNDVVAGVVANTLTLSNISASALVAVAFDRVTSAEMSPEPNPLRAWVRNGLLHVTGLTVGEALHVYTASGALVYHGMATSSEADIPLRVQGLYVVHSGEHTIRVVVH